MKSSAATSAPVFDPARARPVAPYRHEPTGRTVALHQVDGEQAHLFSATGVHVATVAKAEGEQLAAAAKEIALAEERSERELARLAHRRAVHLAKLHPEQRLAFLADEAKANASRPE